MNEPIEINGRKFQLIPIKPDSRVGYMIDGELYALKPIEPIKEAKKFEVFEDPDSLRTLKVYLPNISQEQRRAAAKAIEVVVDFITEPISFNGGFLTSAERLDIARAIDEARAAIDGRKFQS